MRSHNFPYLFRKRFAFSSSLPRRNGFTIIEMLVVSLLFVIILGVGTSVLLTTVNTSTKTDTINKAKASSERASAFMSRELRESRGIVLPSNTTPLNNLVFTDVNGVVVRYRMATTSTSGSTNQVIVRDTSAAGNCQPTTACQELTDGGIDGVHITNLNFQVDQGRKNVAISFRLNRSQNTAIPIIAGFDIVNTTFNTSVTLRN